MEFQILLFYNYVRIKNPQEELARQKAVCEALHLKGRLIIAEEGINGTFEGTITDTEKYIDWMKSDKRYKDIHWKKSKGTGNSFPRLSVKIRKEIVSLHLEDEGGKDINPNKLTGTHLKPEELRVWYESGKEFYIVDMRNDYELKVGKFENTIFPGLRNFRDLRDTVATLKDLKEKPVLTVCTGGVRCEKASGFLKREGFSEVYQLDGGIVSYMERFPGKDFKGSLYVFDNRKIMHFNDPDTHEIIGECEKCNQKSERFINCKNLNCHRHFIVCEECAPSEESVFCNAACEESWKAVKK